ncbi:para-aminobenzoate synthase, (PABA) [Curvularia kusanoi]|uniref:aminodeoxychorismate synthase n=1 Tax=Curvularia kusanoi TaxID=90978 RepID=A0A9P4TFL8_CURKU|nr:para-aminobenzoate synthase, (PABA) [Curvularia kusanoi]
MASASSSPARRILFLDAYDSFSNNIVALIEQNTDAKVTKIPIDDERFEASESSVKSTFAEYVQDFDAVVAGPGPGWAGCDKDVGLMKELWQLQDGQVLPVLGICLGFQSLCLAFGADIERLVEPKHGIVTTVLHKRESLFRQVEKVEATQYHSLQVVLKHPIQIKRAVRYPAQLWESTETCPQLEPLAWDFDSERNGAVLMGVRHIQKPFWGVQFHPESVCTNEAGAQIIRNWWEDSQSWKRKRMFFHSSRKTSFSGSQLRPKTFQDFRRDLGFTAETDLKKAPMQKGLAETEFLAKDSEGLLPDELASLIAYGDELALPHLPPTVVHCATTGSGRLTVEDVCELLEIPRHEAIVLQSGLQENLVPLAVGTGRYSIIGLVIPEETLRLHYYAGSRVMQLRDGYDEIHTEWKVADPWPYMRKVMKTLQPTTLPRTATWAPFWGGLMGYASYEAGLETINVPVKDSADHPDICFAYITRSIVFDHQVKKIYVQSIRGPNDFDWVEETQELIYNAADAKSRESTPTSTPLPRLDPFEKFGPMYKYIDSCKRIFADRETYCEQVRSCQETIADGQSYELCLTHQNEVRARRPTACRLSKAEDCQHSWNMYKRLAGQNPAPFSAYMRMHNVHVLSSSPERYISWSRGQAAQCRPIKGTVQKKPGVTAAHAHAILSSSKERAENLMIVDLTRHQLHGVYGSENVTVSQLMEVEEYETVWQLVTVVDAVPPGQYKPNTPEVWEDPIDGSSSLRAKIDVPDLGFQAFVESLPPGSMTGAPKKRSCEILQEQERGVKRGIYSGVMGYLDVGGGGDFSVVIRTAIKVDATSYYSSLTAPKSESDSISTSFAASTSTKTEDIWRIPAGGAVTSQSTPEGEYEEMLAKVNSTARAFTHLPPPPPKQKKPRVELINPDHPDYEALWNETLRGEGADGVGTADVEAVLRLLQETVQRTLEQGIGIVDEEEINDSDDE